MKKTNLVILGSTGSIGTQTLEIVRKFSDRFNVLALAEGHNVELLHEQIKEFEPQYVFSLNEEISARHDYLDINSMAALPNADIIVLALSGRSGLMPAFAAAAAGKRIALANKETIVMAGQPFLELCRKNGAQVIPVDSEHSALWQCLNGEVPPKRLILTASGGPFRKLDKEKLLQVQPREALNHPSWFMGPKITIDCATLMNKGLEVIEAHHLFDMPFEKISVVIHPQSIIHSMVEWPDGVIKAQMSQPSMLFPIQYALMHPERSANSELPALDLTKIGYLEFEEPNYDKFPCLGLAIKAGVTGGTAPAILCAADEEAVSLFLQNKITFTDIASIIKECLDCHNVEEQTLDNVLRADAWTRLHVQHILSKYQKL